MPPPGSARGERAVAAEPAPSPRIDVVGLGPAGPDLVTAGTLALLTSGATVLLRTARHPAARVATGARSFDAHYERADTFEDVYRAIADDVVAAALADGPVVYAVPGSPSVAERTVALLAADPRVASGAVALEVHPALSFLDLAFTRLGVDPVATGVRVVDAGHFAVGAAGERGPLVVAQCWSREVLSEVKLSVEDAPAEPVTVLHHLGLPDERISEVAWDDLDREVEPDHLTSLWVPRLAAPVAGELVALEELVRTLRARCPWDRVQTHASLGRHLLEEAHEVLEAIDAVAAVDEAAVDEAAGAVEAAGSDGPTGSGGAAGWAVVGTGGSEAEEAAVAHLEEELGDLLFQVYFHAVLAAEAGRFTLADVARGVHDQLVARHPHVFGEVEAATADAVAANWEAIKQAEKGRDRVTEGIPASLPALALAAKLQRKAAAVGMVQPGLADEVARVTAGLTVLGRADTGAVADGAGGGRARAAAVAEVLFAAVGVARVLGVDPETALLARAGAFRDEVDRAG